MVPRGTRSAVAASVLLVLGTVRAEAEPATHVARLVVERDSDAEQCPDTDGLALAVERIRERPDSGTAPYRVHFSRDGTGFSVSILAEPSGRARVLTSADVTCDVIARATAVTLALLFDAEASEARQEPPTPPIRVPEPPPAPPPAPPAHHVARSARRLRGTLGIGAGGLALVTAPVAFAVTGEVGLVASRFRAAIGAAWVPDVATPLGPGEVREGLATGIARLCYAPIAGNFRLDLCSGAEVGALTAHARGFTRDESKKRLWLAIPAEVAASVWAGNFGVEPFASALFPLKRSDFGVDGLGTAYESSRVSALFGLRLIGIVPL